MSSADAVHHQAAFINAIREEGTKTEACDYLQKTWNELCEARKELQFLRDRPQPSPSSADKISDAEVEAARDAYERIAIPASKLALRAALEAAAATRRAQSAVVGDGEKMRQALAVYGEWAIAVSTLGQLADLEHLMAAIGVQVQQLGEWSAKPKINATQEGK